MTNSHTASAAALDESKDLDKIVLYALDEAMEKLEQKGELEPFTVILHGGNLRVESHPGEDAVECFNAASTALQLLAHLMDAYVFAYDGYISTDSDTRDAIIVERGRPGAAEAEAYAVLYTLDEGEGGVLSFEEGIYDLGPASSMLQGAPATSDDLELL
ncbi:MAG: hypothetical protein LBL23_05105 [Coriobacteriales bacterium]|jgi:hypothetical protein|nr:hypothetical protein [Coriobacteriales bacterium]